MIRILGTILVYVQGQSVQECSHGTYGTRREGEWMQVVLCGQEVRSSSHDELIFRRTVVPVAIVRRT